MYGALALMYAAAATALPTSLSAAQALCDGSFSTQMTTLNGVLSLKAIVNGTNPNLVVIGQPTTDPGSVVVSKGTSPEASLSFEIDGEQFGWVVGDAGHVSGIAIGVGAERGYEEPKFTVTDDGSIYHELTAATNMWLACNRTVNGEQHTILAWGNAASAGGFPEGCAYTNVKQSCLSNLAPTYDE